MAESHPPLTPSGEPETPAGADTAGLAEASRVVADANFAHHLMGEYLIQQGLITMDQLAEARNRLAGADGPDGIAYSSAFVPTADGKSLLVIDPRKGSIQQSIPLFAGDAGDGKEEPTGWARYTNGQILVIDENDPSGKKWLPTTAYPRLGLIPTMRGSFLYTGEEPRRESSPQLACLPSPFLNPPGASGPLDLFASPGGELVVAANRGSGTLHVVTTNANEQRGAISIRPAGHAKGIGVGISPEGRTIYITDGLTPRLAVLDITTFKVRHQLFPTGPLGSIAMAPDGQSMMVCFSKGAHEMGVMMLSLPDLRVRHLMNMPGKGEGDRPNLPMITGRMDGTTPGQVYLVAYSFETRDNHYMLVIDRSKHRVTKNFALREMPLTAGLLAPATWCPDPPDLGSMLRRMGLLSEEQLRVARAQMAGSGDDAPIHLSNMPVNPAILSQLPERLIRDRGVIPLNQVDGQLVVAMGNPKDPRARQFVQDLAGDLAVKILPMTQLEFEIFMEDRYPRLMEQFYASQTNQASAGTQPQAVPKPVPPPPRVRPPSPEEMPQTGAPVGGTAPLPPATPRPVTPVAMPANRPGAAQTRPAKANSPLAHDDWSDLPDHHFLLINPIKRQVAELDRTGKAAWLYSPEGDTLTRQFSGFVHASRLPNGNSLIVDMGGNRVIEVAPTKETVWQSLEEAKLKGPRHAVRLATGSTLVVDTGNNRLIEIDANGHPAWSYGEMGYSDKGLFKPSHVWVMGSGKLLVADTGNHRVIEIDPNKGVVWQYGNAVNRLGGGQGSASNQLNEPSACTRLPSGNTLIVDAGNQRVLEVDSLGAVVWTYRPHQVTGGQGIRDPILANRLANGNTVIAGRQGICEVDPEFAVIWEYHLVPPSTPPRAAALRPDPTTTPVALRVAAESDVPIQLPSRFLQADRTQHRVWEVDRQKQMIWQYTGLGAAGNDRTQLDRPHYARRLRNGNTLVTDTGHHRILEVTAQGAVAWEFGQFGKLGGGPKNLANPRSAERLTNGHTLIADQSNKRVIEVTPPGEIVWSYEGTGSQRLQAPTYVTMLPSGNFLIVDWGGHVVLEITPQGKPVWSFGQFGRSGAEPNCLFHPEHASRLSNGNTLITDTQNHRVLEVNSAGDIAWQYGGEAQFLPRVGRFGIQYMTPIAAWRLPNGNVVVQHAGKGHVIEVDRELNILFQFAP